MIQKLSLPSSVELQLNRGDCPDGARSVWKVIYYERGLLPFALSADDTLESALEWVDVECTRFRDGEECYDIDGSDKTLIYDVTGSEVSLYAGDSLSVVCQTFTKQKHSPSHSKWPVQVTVAEKFTESGREFLVLELEVEDEA